MRELLVEPLFPFIKSKDELEYEQRIKKRNIAIGGFKRMQLDVFKKTLNT